MKRAVFLDRDGVINDNKKPVNKPSDFIFFPWTFEALDLIIKANFSIFVVTNQGGIEMGYFTEENLKSIHDYMLEQFMNNNIIIDDVKHCPHFKTHCECRKPLPGMLNSLSQKYSVDLKSSYMVGDREMDIEAGKKAGCTTIKIGKPSPQADYNVSNLLQAAQLIIKI
ncbi:MAG: HAD family hydrolase [Alkaliphilus sp.]|nr:HAD family hydrolase [Alkaliphilus sp.]